jgi:hypothetical protein
VDIVTLSRKVFLQVVWFSPTASSTSAPFLSVTTPEVSVRSDKPVQFHSLSG